MADVVSEQPALARAEGGAVGLAPQVRQSRTSCWRRSSGLRSDWSSSSRPAAATRQRRIPLPADTWSSWSPASTGTLGVREIARHVAPPIASSTAASWSA